MVYKEEYKDCLEYIEAYWDKIIVTDKDNSHMHGFLSVPYPYLTPNTKKFKYLFYWDTFFQFRGLLGTNHIEIMKYMIENFIFLYKRYGIIPNFNSHASTGRSQPPFLSSMIFDVYNETQDKKWLEVKMQYAKLEYTHVWRDREKAYNHGVDGTMLSKYGDRDVGYAYNAELESGWDFTSRFYSRCNEFLPVDLNSYLYKYEKDFLKIAQMFSYEREKIFWRKQLDARRKEIHEKMWDEKKGFFFDYDFVHQQRSEFFALSGFAPMWAGIATHKQAEKMVKNLKEFETDYGLLITSAFSLASDITLDSVPEQYKKVITSLLEPKQWDYPHIWLPIEYLAVVGMLKYGFIEDAKRIMKKSLTGQAKVFRKYGTFFEKIDGVRGDMSQSFHYKVQDGFGWTNAVFYRYVQFLDHMEKNGDDSIYAHPMSEEGPFRLEIPH